MGENKISELLNQPGSAPRPSPQPGPSPTPPSTRPTPSGGGGHEVESDSNAIRKLGYAFENEVGSIFQEARKKLNLKPRNAQPAAFTTFGISCALVYTQLIELADQDLIDKTKAVKEINNKLHEVAKTKDEADRKSTIKEI
ncbi:hypothetical protein ACFQ07_02485 [Actinomadura adrarensis]|uniref:Uncharacterized protein n=1 Tax=Actinomadura adrarensis TaxID=1819600 RepID=A0ABW3CBK9_9ACTN